MNEILSSLVIISGIGCLCGIMIGLVIRVRRLEAWRDLITRICQDAQANDSDYV